MKDWKKPEYGILQYSSEQSSSFDDVPFNEVDGLLLSEIAYIEFQGMGIDYAEDHVSEMTIEELYKRFVTLGTYGQENSEGQKLDDIYTLLANMAENPRYKDMKLGNYISNPCSSGVSGYDKVGMESDKEQFAAITITYEQNGETHTFVSYRGTDATDNGWIEDFLMLCSSETQAQRDSVVYMETIARLYPDSILEGGGHSKGGNDFEYAYLFCNEETNERIKKGYVYDSPGISDAVYNNAGKERFDKYTEITNGSAINPQTSVIGLLLKETGNQQFVYSVESNVKQHDAFSWAVDGNHFTSHEQDSFSKECNELLDNITAKLTDEEKIALYNLIAYLMKNDDDDGIDDFISPKTLTNLCEYIKKCDSSDMAAIAKVVALFEFYLMDDIIKYLPNGLKPMVVSTLISIDAALYAAALKKKVEEIIVSVSNRIEAIWISMKEKIAEVRTKLDILKESFIEAISDLVDKAISMFVDKSQVNSYMNVNPLVYVNTDKAENAANKLRDLNKRLHDLDRRIKRLYFDIGWLDLLDLINSSIKVGYSVRIESCAAYLKFVAEDMQDADENIKRRVKG